MKVGVFLTDTNEEHDRVLTACAKGIRAYGVDVITPLVTEYVPVDIAVVFGVYKKQVPASHARGKVMYEQVKAKKLTLVLEKGFIKRDDYYMAGFNGLNNRAKFNNKNSPPDRWKLLQTAIAPMRSTGENIVICGQVPWDASVQGVDIVNWYGELIKYIRTLTDRPIIFRPHPLAVEHTPDYLGTRRSTRTLAEDFANAFCVVTYNSNTGVDATLAGLPVTAFDKGSMVFDIAGKDIASIAMPLYPTPKKVQQWANDIAYTQWNLQEFAEGLPWRHLLRIDTQRAAL